MAVTESSQLNQLVRPLALAGERTLPVPPRLQALLPDGGLRRGSTVSVAGSTSLALSTVAAASASGSWCAAVGLPSLGLVAAAELGVELARFVLVPQPGAQWPVVVAALLDALDVVMVQPPSFVRPSDARRLSARARERGAVLISVGSAWPQSDVRLECESIEWTGLSSGHGRFRRQCLQVTAGGRGAASQQRHASLVAS